MKDYLGLWAKEFRGADELLERESLRLAAPVLYAVRLIRDPPGGRTSRLAMTVGLQTQRSIAG